MGAGGVLVFLVGLCGPLRCAGDDPKGAVRDIIMKPIWNLENVVDLVMSIVIKEILVVDSKMVWVDGNEYFERNIILAYISNAREHWKHMVPGIILDNAMILSEWKFHEIALFKNSEHMAANIGNTFDSNIYYLGVVFLELITGRAFYDHRRRRGEQLLVPWARPMLEDRDLSPLVDPRLGRRHYNVEGLRLTTVIAERCICRDPKGRLTVSQVDLVLDHVVSLK
ncbi:hypothetical protein GQ457_01G002980 [Hibiscus cannabinus]